MGPKPAGLDLEAESPEGFGKEVDQGLGLLGRGRIYKRRPPAPAGVRQQGELAYDQNFAPGVQHRPVHPAGVVGEDSQVSNLIGEPAGTGIRIIPGDPDQDDKAGPDFGDELAVDPDGTPADPLDDRPQLGAGFI